MKFTIVFVTLVAAVYGASVHPEYERESRIINGKDAEPQSAKYIVSIKATQLWVIKSHICGGSIISPEWILTAAHCVSTNDLEIVAGLHVRNNEKDCQVIKVDRKVVHDGYSNGVGPYDIALLHLEKPLTYNDHIQPVVVPPMGKIHSGAVHLFGWGKTSNGFWGNLLPQTLQTVDTVIVPFDECLAMQPDNSPLDNTMVCSSSLDSKISACNGDSGGPIVQNNVENGTIELVGVVSWGYTPCGDANLPSVYTRTSAYTEWISGITKLKF